MLHRLGSIFFILAIISSFYKYLKFINKKSGLQAHIVTGTISALAMIIYSIVDYFKDNEISIMFVGLFSFLIILSGTNEIKKKYKWLHLVCVIGFASSLAFHIMY